MRLPKPNANSVMRAAAACMVAFALCACGSTANTDQLTDQGSDSGESVASTVDEASSSADEVQELVEDEVVQSVFVINRYTETFADPGSEPSSGTLTTEFTLDEAGNPMSMSFVRDADSDEYDFIQQYSYQTDENGAHTSSDKDDGHHTDYETTYDDQGRPSSVAIAYSSSSATRSYSYNDAGQLVSMQEDFVSPETDYSYTTITEFNEFGWITKTTSTSNVGLYWELVYTYEGDDPAHPTSASLQELTTDEVTGTTSSVSSYALSYDANGNLVQVDYTSDSGTGSCTYEYVEVESPSVVVALEAALKSPYSPFYMYE